MFNEEFVSVKNKIDKYFDGDENALLHLAYDYSYEMHKEQKRASGEPYFIHPCAVAEILIDLGLNASAIAAALLHDVIEDTPATLDDIKNNFGTEIRDLVDGVTKLEKIRYTSREEEDAENFRKIFIAMAKDIRVIIIKLADRLHNMRSLNFLSNERQQRMARETLEIYTPLAGRLGIQQIKCELEDLCLKYLEPESYEYLVENIDLKLAERRSFVDFVVKELQNLLDESGIKGEVVGRPKNFYSIYRKMVDKNKTLDQIYDLTAVRVLCNSTELCYEILGKIHFKWKPVPGRIKDYIATPKRNMYQSLHTTVVTNFGQIFEIQIRTYEMHHMAEYGIAAHWRYKEKNNEESEFNERISWIRDMLDWQKGVSDSHEFMDSLKSDLYTNELLVFTPQGKVISLPKDATPVDFAYAIHSEVGNKCVGAKVNSKITALDSTLHTGDIVEIITSSSSKGPSWDWLKFIKSSSARGKIRTFFKKELKDDNIKLGKTMLENDAKRRGYNLNELLTDDNFQKLAHRFVFMSQNEMFASVGYGAIGVAQIMNRLVDYHKKDMPRIVAASEIGRLKRGPEGSVTLDNGAIEGLLVKFAHCCNPVPGDDIVGYTSRGRGVIIHRSNCPNIRGYEADRLQPATWTGETEKGFQAGLRILTDDDKGIIAFITGEIAALKLSVTQINGRVTKEGNGLIDIYVTLNKTSDIDLLIKHIRKDKRILDVYRTKN